MQCFTTIRIRTPDSDRIKDQINRYNKQHIGRCAAHDIVKIALDLLEENINKKNGISTALTGETPNIT